MIVATPRYLPETERRSGRFDLPGALTSTLGMTALVYGIVRSADAGWSDPLTVRHSPPALRPRTTADVAASSVPV